MSEKERRMRSRMNDFVCKSLCKKTKKDIVRCWMRRRINVWSTFSNKLMSMWRVYVVLYVNIKTLKRRRRERRGKWQRWRVCFSGFSQVLVFQFFFCIPLRSSLVQVCNN
ncbi:hypothetical protein ANCDUO_22191 [Ancylostoma duodenale]|uniref:Uncharacterized protein n=1 Tax=Ancylostoma duodenale TaxID=51022 RepID=A0A0C2FLY9_9BILA|nr:hypothetical protein ANCDUO_22191 [Ancylostoma duodenale]